MLRLKKLLHIIYTIQNDDIYKQSTLNLYDANTKTQLFQVKSEENKASLTSSKEIAFSGEKLSVKNYDADGNVVSQVDDVAGGINNNSSAIANEVVQREEAVAQEATTRAEQIQAEQTAREIAITNEATLRQEAVNAEASTRASEITAEQNARATAITEAKADLEAKVNAEKARIDLILQGSDVSLDQFREIVDYANNISTEKMEQINAVANNLSQHEDEYEKLKQVVISLAPDAASLFA